MDSLRRHSSTFSVLLVLFVPLFIVSPLFGQAAAPSRKNLVINGGFEDTSQAFPPSGWKVWGESIQGIAERFKLDPVNPHEGRFSWRVDHPTGTHAFPVSDPSQPIKTKIGKAYQLDTGWGLSGAANSGDDTPARYWRNSNIVGTLHRAVRMIYYAREGMLRGASSWEMFARPHHVTFAFLTRDFPEQRFMLYWLYYHFNRHCGRVALDITGTAPWHEVARNPESSGPVTPALITLSQDGHEMFLVIANGSWNDDYPCTVALANFRAATATGYVLSQQDYDANPLVRNESDVVKRLTIERAASQISFTVPAHSVSFVRLESEQ